MEDVRCEGVVTRGEGEVHDPDSGDCVGRRLRPTPVPDTTERGGGGADQPSASHVRSPVEPSQFVSTKLVRSATDALRSRVSPAELRARSRDRRVTCRAPVTRRASPVSGRPALLPVRPSRARRSPRHGRSLCVCAFCDGDRGRPWGDLAVTAARRCGRLCRCPAPPCASAVPRRRGRRAGRGRRGAGARHAARVVRFVRVERCATAASSRRAAYRFSDRIVRARL